MPSLFNSSCLQQTQFGSSDNALLNRLIIISCTVSLFPIISLLYTFIVYFSYSFYREIKWTNTKLLKDIFVRWLIVVTSWLVSIGVTILCCGISCNNNDNDNEEEEENTNINNNINNGCLIGTTAAVTILFIMISIYFIIKTRREDVVGCVTTSNQKIKVPIFYGSNALKGKIILITGANNGIGKETTRQLAAQGATIIMLCRNPIRCKNAINSIIEIQQHLHLENPKKYPTVRITKDQLIYVPIDLTDFNSIYKSIICIKQYIDIQASKLGGGKNQYIHSLICNAGLMMGTQSTTKDGYETMMQANHLGHFLLMKLLLDNQMLKTTITINSDANDNDDEPSRVCILTSSTYEFSCMNKTKTGGTNKTGTGFDFNDPFCHEGIRQYTLFGQYSMTKLANLLIAKELYKRYNNNNNNTDSNNNGRTTNTTRNVKNSLAVFAVHPGIVRTNVTSNMNWYYRLGNNVFSYIVSSISKTAEEGAYSSTYVISTPFNELKFSTGAPYIVNCKEQCTNEYITNPNGGIKDSKQLWNWSEQQLVVGVGVGGSSAIGLTNIVEEDEEEEEEENDDSTNEKKEQ
jgi:NAD(P)-dependent dehydrogenase (short-subunit alcohol dehydrogenase family)